MRLPVVFLSLACALAACNSHQPASETKTVSVKDYTVIIDGYDFTDTAAVRLKCTTNLPAQTRLVVQKGLRFNSTSPETEQFHTADTIAVSNSNFIVFYPAKFIGGYIDFAVWPDMQSAGIKDQLTKRDAGRPELAYYSEYNINSKDGNRDTALIISKVQ